MINANLEICNCGRGREICRMREMKECKSFIIGGGRRGLFVVCAKEGIAIGHAARKRRPLNAREMISSRGSM